eukprot:GHVP01054716.1.p1 GENE.GHVP01054716.1~~GHVP01054716.1.p1  ORF type:complete len:141 (-),score=35.02 GHVP01054716.1:100-522(-)
MDGSGIRDLELMSLDGKICIIAKEKTQSCGFLADASEDVFHDPVPLPFYGPVIENFVEFLCSCDATKSLPGERMRESPESVVTPEAKNFIESKSVEETLELCKAAHFLDEQNLEYLCCYRLATILLKSSKKEIESVLDKN